MDDTYCIYNSKKTHRDMQGRLPQVLNLGHRSPEEDSILPSHELWRVYFPPSATYLLLPHVTDAWQGSGWGDLWGSCGQLFMDCRSRSCTAQSKNLLIPLRQLETSPVQEGLGGSSQWGRTSYRWETCGPSTSRLRHGRLSFPQVQRLAVLRYKEGNNH